MLGESGYGSSLSVVSPGRGPEAGRDVAVSSWPMWSVGTNGSDIVVSVGLCDVSSTSVNESVPEFVNVVFRAVVRSDEGVSRGSLVGGESVWSSAEWSVSTSVPSVSSTSLLSEMS